MPVAARRRGANFLRWCIHTPGAFPAKGFQAETAILIQPMSAGASLARGRSRSREVPDPGILDTHDRPSGVLACSLFAAADAPEAQLCARPCGSCCFRGLRVLSSMDVHIPHCGGDPMPPDGCGGFECPVCGSSHSQRHHGGWALPAPHPKAKRIRAYNRRRWALKRCPAPPASWWDDTTPEAQRRRAYKRHHGDGGVKDQVYERNEIIVVLWANGARQVTVAAAFRLSQGHVSKVCNDPRWSGATELPPVEPALLEFLRDFGVNIPATSSNVKRFTIWVGLGLMVLFNGVDMVLLTRARRENPDFPAMRYRSRRRQPANR